MTGKIRSILVALAVTTGLLVAAPVALADTPVSFAAYECQDLGTDTVRIAPDGTVQIRGNTLLGESESDDPRFDGLFRRRSNIDIYPDGSGVIWGVHDQRSWTSNGKWKIGFMVPFTPTEGGSGTGSGAGSRDFAGLTVSGTINTLFDASQSPCQPVLGAATFDGVVTP